MDLFSGRSGCAISESNFGVFFSYSIAKLLLLKMHTYYFCFITHYATSVLFLRHVSISAGEIYMDSLSFDSTQTQRPRAGREFPETPKMRT